ncbi:dnaJ homolog subfamily C member 7-like [Dendronephthya gigantea]|uniref:dnaJ homolog subfamily C member 7-like n=1 Tax=Dendronephthya gigantea TaxID=151771 RepID=UPI00106DBD38|nr:dnaJ homolog subfamily C member 7-like [Dendronephthya gigantea]
MAEDMEYEYWHSSQTQPLLCSEGDKAFHEGKYEDAIRIYTESLVSVEETNRSCAPIYGNRATSRLKLKQYDEAKKDAKKAIELDTNCIGPYLTFVRCELAQGSNEPAEKILNMAKEIDPHHVDLAKESERLRQIKNTKKAVESAYTEKKFEEMAQNAIFLVNLAPECDRYQVMHAESLALLGEFEEAFNIADSVRRRDQNNLEARYVCGFCLYYQGNLSLADDTFAKVLNDDPSHLKSETILKKIKTFKTLHDNARQACENGNFGQAIDFYTSALRVDETNKSYLTQLYLNRGLIAEKKLNWFHNAIKDYSEVLKFDSEHVKAVYNRAKCFDFIGEYQKASDEFLDLFKKTGKQDHRNLYFEALDAENNLRISLELLSLAKTQLNESNIEKAYKKKLFELCKGCDPGASTQMRKQQEEQLESLERARLFLHGHLKRKDGVDQCDVLSLKEVSHMI